MHVHNQEYIKKVKHVILSGYNTKTHTLLVVLILQQKIHSYNECPFYSSALVSIPDTLLPPGESPPGANIGATSSSRSAPGSPQHNTTFCLRGSWRVVGVQLVVKLVNFLMQLIGVILQIIVS
jgi:hypothetical protein